MPKVPSDLTKHNCIGIRQGEEAYGVWRLTSGRGKSATTEAVKTRGNLTTNDGEIAVNWALEGHDAGTQLASASVGASRLSRRS